MFNFDQSLSAEGLLIVRGLAGSVLVVLVAVIGYRILMRVLGRLEARQRLPGRIIDTFRRILRWVLFVLVVLLVLQQFNLLGNAWTALSAALAVVGVGFIATWSILSNMSCSLILVIIRPFDIGDTVELVSDNVGGKVVNFNLLFTTLEDGDGAQIQIPNNLFFQRPIRRRAGERTQTLDEHMRQEETDRHRG